MAASPTKICGIGEKKKTEKENKCFVSHPFHQISRIIFIIGHQILFEK
jgi:hypothetical protein